MTQAPNYDPNDFLNLKLLDDESDPPKWRIRFAFTSEKTGKNGVKEVVRYGSHKEIQQERDRLKFCLTQGIDPDGPAGQLAVPQTQNETTWNDLFERWQVYRKTRPAQRGSKPVSPDWRREEAKIVKRCFLSYLGDHRIEATDPM